MIIYFRPSVNKSIILLKQDSEILYFINRLPITPKKHFLVGCSRNVIIIMRLDSGRCHPDYVITFDSAAELGIRTKQEIADALRFRDKIYSKLPHLTCI
jgi:hypothetical protein